MLSNQRNIQNLDVRHRPMNRFVSGLPFLLSLIPYPAGRADTQVKQEVKEGEGGASGTQEEEIQEIAKF